MQEKLLKKIIPSFVGQEGEKLVDLLYKKQNVNEFLIAKKLNLTINQTRNILYKLADQGLVEFIRKKDKKKGGWYTYFWTLRVKKSLIKFKEDITKQVSRLRNQLHKRQTIRFYHCENCDIEFGEEDAMLQEYTCPECGEIMKIKDTQKIADNLKQKIENLDSFLIEINKEIEIIEEKEEKSKERKLKIEKKKKDEERKKKRKLRELEKKREAKKLGRKVKKKAKKKVKKKKRSLLKALKKISNKRKKKK